MYNTMDDFRRVDILDRKNVVLARNMIMSNVYLNANNTFDTANDLVKLSHIFPNITERLNKIESNILSKKQTGKTNLVLIEKNILPSQKDLIMKYGISGVEFENSKKRIYPCKVASHILGFTSDNHGISGVEMYFDDYLTDPVNAKKPLHLSIDIDIQYIVREAIAKLIKKHDAKGGFGLILNIKTGEVISAVSLPDFNPNTRKGYSKDDMMNKFSVGVYELGSVFKVFLGGIVIKKNLSLHKKYSIKNSLDVDGFVIKNFRFSLNRSDLTIPEMIKYSSNIGCAMIAVDIDSESYRDFFVKLGFDDKINIQLPERSKPIFPHNWSKATMATISYGHGIAITPLHFVIGLAGMLNNGIVPDPTLLRVDNGSQIKTRGLIFTKQQSESLREMLRNIELGNRTTSSIKEYDVFSKSGTAILTSNDGSYDRDKMMLSFFIAGPLFDPQYVFYFGINEPNLDKTGGSRFATGGHVIGHVAANVVKVVGPMLGMGVCNKQKTTNTYAQ
ncbi:MAG: penicillin-binding protein 2 [Alphaproteobacteria bacterium]|nr:penicillin-binding protein 2 [Rickettsiales bacterium]